MKARRRNSNDEWKEVKYVQLEGRDILFQQDYLEFDTTDKTNEQIANDAHWQDVRERAAMAALQGILANASLVDMQYEYRITVAKASVGYADELVKKLKEQNNEKN